MDRQSAMTCLATPAFTGGSLDIFRNGIVVVFFTL
jgi:hypothetical protein